MAGSDLISYSFSSSSCSSSSLLLPPFLLLLLLLMLQLLLLLRLLLLLLAPNWGELRATAAATTAAGEHEAALAEFHAILHSLLQVYFKFTAPPLCLIYGARGGHGKALARCAPAPGGRLRHRPHRRGLLGAGGGGGGGGRRRTAGWGLPPAAWRPGACASLSPRPWQCRQIRPPPRPKSNEASGGARIYSCVRPLTRSSRMRKMPAD